MTRLSETKIITESSHHFPLVQMANITYSDSGIFTDGWTCTNRIAQGTANNQRIGNSATIVKVKYKFNLYAPTGQPDTIRILSIIDKNPKGVPPLLTHMFDDPNNNFTCIAPNSTHQYQIIHDALIDVGGIYLTRSHMFNLSRKLDTQYFGVNNDLASMTTNALYIIVISVNGTGASECLNFWSSCIFKDL